MQDTDSGSDQLSKLKNTGLISIILIGLTGGGFGGYKVFTSGDLEAHVSDTQSHITVEQRIEQVNRVNDVNNSLSELGRDLSDVRSEMATKADLRDVREDVKDILIILRTRRGVEKEAL